MLVKYQHNCKSCLYLGEYKGSPEDGGEHQYDLYCCHFSHHSPLQFKKVEEDLTILVRFGDRPGEIVESEKPTANTINAGQKQPGGIVLPDYYFRKYTHTSVKKAWEIMCNKGLDKLDIFRYKIYKAIREGQEDTP